MAASSYRMLGGDRVPAGGTVCYMLGGSIRYRNSYEDSVVKGAVSYDISGSVTFYSSAASARIAARGNITQENIYCDIWMIKTVMAVYVTPDIKVVFADGNDSVKLDVRANHVFPLSVQGVRDSSHSPDDARFVRLKGRYAKAILRHLESTATTNDSPPSYETAPSKSSASSSDYIAIPASSPESSPGCCVIA